MTRQEAVEQKGWKTVDYALPQGFFDAISSILKGMNVENSHPWAHFVWVYDNNSFGEAGALTAEGEKALRRYNRFNEHEEFEAERVDSEAIDGLWFK